MKDRMDFNEADHPRDENGQFAEGEGSSSGSTESGPARYLPKVKMPPALGLLLLKNLKTTLHDMALRKWASSRKKNTSRKASTF